MLTPGDKMYAFIMPFSPARDRCTEAAEWLENMKEEKKETQQPQEVTPTKGPHKDSSASVSTLSPSSVKVVVPLLPTTTFSYIYHLLWKWWCPMHSLSHTWKMPPVLFHIFGIVKEEHINYDLFSYLRAVKYMIFQWKIVRKKTKTG